MTENESDFFSRTEAQLRDGIRRGANLPWPTRARKRVLSLGRRTKGFAALGVVLVIAAPAVGAVSNWFSFGKPNVPPPAKAGYMFGLERAGSSRLLPIRVADPEGGPAWGLRLVKTSRDDTCVQLGRVEGDQLGSLGIDGAWNDDHRFHAISPKDDPVDQCGSTDAAGYGYVNRGIVGEVASANVQHQGKNSASCTPPQYAFLTDDRTAPKDLSTRPESSCPARVVFLGLLGPDAASVTYRKPGGALATERTSGGVGAYLIVFPYSQATCFQYSHSARRSESCDAITVGGVSPTLPGAVTKITYKDGHSCSLLPSAKLEAADEALSKKAITEVGEPPHAKGSPANVIQQGPRLDRWRAEYRKRLTELLAARHLSLTSFYDQLGFGGCPAVGWVAFKQPKITRAQVESPVVVKQFPAAKYGCPNKLHLPQGCDGLNPEAAVSEPIEWSFKAREAVTNSRHWYEWSVTPTSGQNATNCGGSSFSTYTNITKDTTLHYSQFFPPTCRGEYSIVVQFMAQAPPGATDDDNAGTGPGGDSGLITVGTATFRIR